MRRLAVLAAFALMLLGAARTARAQYDGGDGVIALLAVGVAIEGGAAVGGIVTGIGSSVYVGLGEPHRKWFIASYVFGGVNALATAFWAVQAAGEPFTTDLYAGIAAAHASIAAWDLIMPTIGLVRGGGPHVSPVAVGGRDAGGRLWSGAGIQVSHF